MTVPLVHSQQVTMQCNVVGHKGLYRCAKAWSFPTLFVKIYTRYTILWISGRNIFEFKRKPTLSKSFYSSEQTACKQRDF